MLILISIIFGQVILYSSSSGRKQSCHMLTRQARAVFRRTNRFAIIQIHVIASRCRQMSMKIGIFSLLLFTYNTIIILLEALVCCQYSSLMKLVEVNIQ